jgi:hypothetical protein
VQPEIRRETADRLLVRVDSPVSGILVWSRTRFAAWVARVDGHGVPTLLADGHLVGVPVPAGSHEIEVVWSRRPVFAGLALAAMGLALVAFLRR